MRRWPSIITAQAALAVGQMTFVKMTNGGSGYTQATVSFSGADGGGGIGLGFWRQDHRRADVDLWLWLWGGDDGDD